jgi:plastocyanin
VHSAATLLLPVAAEKSKVPFYIAGGLLASWAVIVSVGLGLRKPAFPGGVAGQRGVIAISAVLVLAAVATAVVTSSAPAKSAAATVAQTAAPASPPGAEAPPAGSTPPPPASAPAPAAPTPTKAAGKKRRRKSASSTATPAQPSASASSIALAASPTGLSYDKKQLSAKAGAVTITLANAAQLEHNVTIAEGSKVLGATPSFVGGSRALTLTLKAGTYTFYCSVPGHRQAGMEGTLTVT